MAAMDVELPLEDGPWDGMLDSIAPTARAVGKYLLGQNIYPLDPDLGDGLVGRPGVRVLGAQLGAGAVRRCQGFYQFTKDDGTEYTIAIVGGKFYTLNWNTEVWTETITGAALAGAAITLDTLAAVAFLTFHNNVILSDGVNTPWAWDGAVLTKLTNAPVIYGQPWIYEGRWMGIKAAEPSVFVWSETDVLNTGFEAGGFNNAWRLTQTDPNRLYAGSASNDGITLLRARSATVAGGPVGPDFSSASSRESMSTTEGTRSPFAVVRHGNSLVLIDSDMHPQLVPAGGTSFTPIWTAMRETLKRLPRTPTALAKCMGCLYSPAGLIFHAVPDVGASECNLLIVYDAKVPGRATPVAVWRGFGELTAMGMVKNGTAAALGTPYFLHGGTDGYVYLHGNPEDAGPWDDVLVAGTVPIEHIFEGQALGFSTKREKIYDRIDLTVRVTTALTLDVSATTPRGASSIQRIVIDTGIDPPPETLWDTGLWDVMAWDTDPGFTGEEAHGDAGLDLQARWIRPRISHAVLGEQFGLVGLTVLAYTSDDDPEAP